MRERTGLTDANAKRALTVARKQVCPDRREFGETDVLRPLAAHPNGRRA